MRLIPKVLKPSERARKRAEKNALETVKRIKNEDLQQNLDLLLHSAMQSLHTGVHEKVALMLHELLLHDLNLRKIIDSQIMDGQTVSKKTLENTIELQSLYTISRNNLLMAIIENLLSGYDVVKDYLSQGIDSSRKYALEYYDYTMRLHSYYIQTLEFLTQSSDTQEMKIYQECIMLMNEPYEQAQREIQALLIDAGVIQNPSSI